MAVNSERGIIPEKQFRPDVLALLFPETQQLLAINFTTSEVKEILPPKSLSDKIRVRSQRHLKKHHDGNSSLLQKYIFKALVEEWPEIMSMQLFTSSSHPDSEILEPPSSFERIFAQHEPTVLMANKLELEIRRLVKKGQEIKGKNLVTGEGFVTVWKNPNLHSSTI